MPFAGSWLWQPVEINQSEKVIFHRLGHLLRKTDILKPFSTASVKS
jgi:hypothetical protein